MDMLDSHPAVASYDELLAPGAKGRGEWGRTDLLFFEPYYVCHRRRNHLASRALWLFRYLDALYSPRRNTEAIGMKLMYDQLWHNPWTLIYMVRHRLRVVHLVRANLLDVIVSTEAAQARRQHHAFQGHLIETPALTLNPAKVTSMLRTLERRVKIARNLLKFLRIKHIELSYEQLLAEPRLVKDVLTFLNVDIELHPPSLASRFRKLNTAKKRDIIDNYAELVSALKGTRFERYLNE